jgi:carbonic anhydrase/acetyltransferase-like protein (isoleucine patch superfamily)
MSSYYPQGNVYAFGGDTPRIDPSAYVAPGAQVIGRVTLAARSSVWFNAVLRGDLAAIEVGEGSNIQDNTTIHVDGKAERSDGRERGCRIGQNVTIGHNCIVHSCTVEDDVLVGMGAVVLSGAVIGRGSVVGAGAVVLGDVVIPPYSLVVGNPGQVKKTYAPDFVARYNHVAAQVYRQRILDFKQGLKRVDGLPLPPAPSP